jgi:LemA protein
VNKLRSRVIGALALAILPLGLAGCGVNAIPTKEETAKAKFADLQADYQRRADLIPNLVATVQGYAQQ